MGLFDISKKESTTVSSQNSSPQPSNGETVSSNDTCFTIDGDRLIKYIPRDSAFYHEVFVPNTIQRIEKAAFPLSANVLHVHIPSCVKYIDDEAFGYVKFVTILGTPGSYAEKYAERKKGELLPRFKFASDYFPDAPPLECNHEKETASEINDVLQRFIKLESLPCSNPRSCTFPLELFYASSKLELYAKDVIETIDVIIQMPKAGCLVAETKHTLLDMYSSRSQGSYSTTRNVAFSELPTLIAQAKDRRASEYLGMTEENWHDFFTLPEKEPSRFPVVQFGRYLKYHDSSKRYPIEWFILTENHGKILLLAREGLDICQYDNEHILRYYTPQWEKSNLYNWLNGVFYSAAFEEDEKKYIIKTNHTIASVFCLSKDEFRQYLVEDSAAQMRPTDYAQHKGAAVFTIFPGLDKDNHQFEGNGYWWLRDEIGEGRMLKGNACVASVSNDGEIGWSFSNCKKTCVRPAIWVSVDYWKNK